MIAGNVKPIRLSEIENLSPFGKDPHLSLSHNGLYHALVKCAKKIKWTVEGVECGLSANELMCALSLRVSSKHLPALPTKLFYSFGVFNSNERHHAMKFYAGVVNKVGVVMNEVPVTARHSINADITTSVTEAMEVAAILMEAFPDDIKSMRRVSIDERTSEHYLLDAARKGLMPWSRLGHIDRVFRTGEQTLWRLLTSFATQARRNPPRFQLRQMYGFKELCTEQLVNSE